LGSSDPRQPAVEHALDGLWDLRLGPPWAIPPGAQEQAVRQIRLLTDARHHQLALLLVNGDWDRWGMADLTLANTGTLGQGRL
jgi:hypothetical protein